MVNSFLKLLECKKPWIEGRSHGLSGQKRKKIGWRRTGVVRSSRKDTPTGFVGCDEERSTGS